MDARLWAFVAFMSFQIGTYLATIVSSLLILPLVYPLFNAVGISVEIAQIGLVAVLFYVVRDQILTRAWRRLLSQTDTQPNELDFLTPTIVRAEINLHDDVQTVARA